MTPLRLFLSFFPPELSPGYLLALAGPVLEWMPRAPGARQSELSPCPVVFLGQDRLEPILLRAAREQQAEVRFRHELQEFTQDPEGVTARILDRATGEAYTVRADYLVAADGVRSSIREALGIPHRGSSASPYVTVRVGTAAARPRPGLYPEALLDAADEAMFEAKRLGRNRVCEGTVAEPTQIVEVDPLLVGRIPKFLANRRDDVQKLIDAAQSGALDVAYRIGHNLKGIGSSYGFDPISEIGRRVEAASRANEVDGLRRAALDLASYLDQVRVVRRGGDELPEDDTLRNVQRVSSDR